MVVPASEVGYTSATTGRGDHEVHKGRGGIGGEKKTNKRLYHIHYTPVKQYKPDAHIQVGQQSFHCCPVNTSAKFAVVHTPNSDHIVTVAPVHIMKAHGGMEV
jgi:hypothetical protein